MCFYRLLWIVLFTAHQAYYKLLDSTAKIRLVDAWCNHDPEEKDFSEVITESFRNVTSPFSDFHTKFR